jgi:hypothetical protein
VFTRRIGFAPRSSARNAWRAKKVLASRGKASRRA